MTLPSRPLALVALLAILGASCATAGRRTAGPVVLTFPPQEITVSPLDLELEGKSADELFAAGTAAYEAKDWARAAVAFARVADRFPGSPKEATALFDAGLAYYQMGEWRLAMERFAAMAKAYEGPDALEASFDVAECQYRLGDRAAARATLEEIAARPALPAPQRVRVLAERAVLELEDGGPDAAEATLDKALAVWRSFGEAERQALDPHWAAQAEYYLGEVRRARFLAVGVDPAAGDEKKLEDALETKANLLLDAQAHYLRAIHLGDPRWAVASGVRVGELYDAFRTQLLDAPLPPALDEESARAYRDELRRRVRVLADKAIDAYRSALDFAARRGVDDRYLGDAQAAFERLRAALGDEGGAAM